MALKVLSLAMIPQSLQDKWRKTKDAKKKEKEEGTDICEKQSQNVENGVTYQKGIMATVAMDMVTNDNYCYSQRNQYQPP